jgi:hypothetical protein
MRFVAVRTEDRQTWGESSRSLAHTCYEAGDLDAKIALLMSAGMHDKSPYSGTSACRQLNELPCCLTDL